ncbi:MAG: hypothetical protein K2M12_05075, partial [Muribaculaceae bacterium]|nr:hypothetical protein [Muribaculaceae bacterium]
MNKLLLFAGVLCISMPAVARKAPLHIVSGADTETTSPAHTIVGITAPGASATVNGEDVKVYPNTGCFGTKLTLKPGVNKIKVAIRDGKTSADTTFTVTLADKKPAKPMAKKPAKRETIFAEPIAVRTDSGAYLQYAA